MKRPTKPKLFNNNGDPVHEFNEHVLSWLDGTPYADRPSPKAFTGLLAAYNESVKTHVTDDTVLTRWKAQRHALTGLTETMFSFDMTPELLERMSQREINPNGGFRTPLAQSAAKNIGEHFANLTVYGLADALKFQDDILVTKGIPPHLRSKLILKRNVFNGTNMDTLFIPIEVDLCIFRRSNPTDAIIVSAKTSLKQTFHQATMYKLFFDCFKYPEAQRIWGLYPNDGTDVTKNMLYVFTTADMIKTTGHNTEGPDIERDEVRNLIKLDSSFFDYTFVSKRNIQHVSKTLTYGGDREALFHEMGCLLDLVKQKFTLTIPVHYRRKANLDFLFADEVSLTKGV